MDFLSKEKLADWMAYNAVSYDRTEFYVGFNNSDEPMFRIPIGDYQLQLDFRINAALQLIAKQQALLLFNRKLEWASDSSQSDALAAFLRGMGLHKKSGALRIAATDRPLAFLIAYLTNRWGTSHDSIYIAAEEKPELLVNVHGSPESVFVICRTDAAHDAAVQQLRGINVPAYGPLVKDPLVGPIYEDVALTRSSVVTVDPETGKPFGPGSDESVLLPEYMPPEC